MNGEYAGQNVVQKCLEVCVCVLVVKSIHMLLIIYFVSKQKCNRIFLLFSFIFHLQFYKLTFISCTTVPQTPARTLTLEEHRLQRHEIRPTVNKTEQAHFKRAAALCAVLPPGVLQLIWIGVDSGDST